MTDSTIAHELVSQANALRSLARALVGPADADDLLQDTAVRALRSPPAEPSAAQGWLRTVMLRLSANRRRDESRRRRRERGAARDEALPPADALAQRREALRAVTDALLALPEPYQSTLLLRYFEGLTPSAIARRTAAPIATVKSRLQRGLAMLRERLDRRDPRSWRGALLAATGVLAPPALTWTTGSLLMTHAAKTITAAALVCGALLLWDLGRAPEPDGAVADARPDAVTAAASAHAGDAAGGAREAVSPGEATPPGLLAHPYAFELRCRVIDRWGLPVRAAGLSLAPLGCALNAYPESTDVDGRVTIRWRGRQQSAKVAVALRHRGSQALQEVALAAGEPREVVLLAGGPQPASACSSMNQRCAGCHTERPLVRHLVHSRLPFHEPLHPEARWGDLLLPAPAHAESEVLEDITEEILDGGEEAGGVEGVVLAEGGEPVPNAVVVLGEEPGVPRDRTTAGADGAFRFDWIDPGRYWLFAAADREGKGEAEVAVLARQKTRVPVQLRRGATIRGTARATDGTALAGHRVEYVSLGEPWRAAGAVGTDGSFVLAGLPTGAGRLLLRPGEGRLPVAVVDGVLPGAGPVELRLDPQTRAAGRVRFRPDPSALRELTELELRLWQIETGEGVSLLPEGRGVFGLGDLMAGFYRVAIGGDTVGWVDLGRHWVDGRSTVDLGTVALPQPATLHLPERPADLAFELYHRRAGGDFRVEASPDSLGEVMLPGGDWLALWRGHDQVLHARAFTLRAGVPSTLELVPGGR